MEMSSTKCSFNMALLGCASIPAPSSVLKPALDFTVRKNVLVDQVQN